MYKITNSTAKTIPSTHPHRIIEPHIISNPSLSISSDVSVITVYIIAITIAKT